MGENKFIENVELTIRYVKEFMMYNKSVPWLTLVLFLKFTFLFIKFLNNEFYPHWEHQVPGHPSANFEDILLYTELCKVSRGPCPRCQGEAGHNAHFIISTFIKISTFIFKYGIFKFPDINRIEQDSLYLLFWHQVNYAYTCTIWEKKNDTARWFWFQRRREMKLHLFVWSLTNRLSSTKKYFSEYVRRGLTLSIIMILADTEYLPCTTSCANITIFLPKNLIKIIISISQMKKKKKDGQCSYFTCPGSLYS